MPNKTSISKSKKITSGFVKANERVTLQLCFNASGDFLINPLMVYRSQDPRSLSVGYKYRFLWIVSKLFCSWRRNYKNNLDFKTVLVLDNAPGYSRELEVTRSNIKVISVLQSMNQGILPAFKLYYVEESSKWYMTPWNVILIWELCIIESLQESMP